MARVKTVRMPAPTEDQEQIWLFEWIEQVQRDPRLPDVAKAFHVPNGGKRNIATAARMKRMGVRAGVPDVWLPVARAGAVGLVIELKRADRSNRTSGAQDEWIVFLAAQGWRAEVAYGWVQAAAALLRYYEVPRSAWEGLGVYGEGATQ